MSDSNTASMSECRTPAILPEAVDGEGSKRGREATIPPQWTTPSSLKLSGRITKKYQRLRARPSPLRANVRRCLLDKIGATDVGSPDCVVTDMDD